MLKAPRSNSTSIHAVYAFPAFLESEQLLNSYTCIKEPYDMIQVALLRSLVGLSLAH